MDTLSWLKINKDIKLKVTTKSFYGKYLYKIKVYSPGFRICSGLNFISESNLKKKVKEIHAYSTRGWSTYHHLAHIDAGQTVWLVTALANLADEVSIRFESPHLTIYANSEDTLYKVASTCPKKLQVIELSKPCDNTMTDLQEDTVFVVNEPEFKFKVVTREGVKVPQDIQKQLKEYALSLGNELKVSESLLQRLGSARWLPAGSIQFNDEKILLFLRMIAPTLLAKVYKLKALPSINNTST